MFEVGVATVVMYQNLDIQPPSSTSEAPAPSNTYPEFSRSWPQAWVSHVKHSALPGAPGSWLWNGPALPALGLTSMKQSGSALCSWLLALDTGLPFQLLGTSRKRIGRQIITACLSCDFLKKKIFFESKSFQVLRKS